MTHGQSGSMDHSKLSLSGAIPAISTSRGGLALALAGYKTVHYTKFNPDIARGKIAFLNSSGLTIPVVIESVSNVNPSAELNAHELFAAGKHVEKTNGSAPALDKEADAERSARDRALTFVRAMVRQKIKDQLTPMDIAHTKPKELVQKITYRLATHNDLAHLDDKKQLRRHLMRAREHLDQFMTNAHAYLFPREPRQIPAPPRDMSGIYAWLTLDDFGEDTQLRPFQRRMAVPFEHVSGALSTETQRDKRTKEEGVDGMGLSRQLVNYPQVPVTLGAAVLNAMNAVPVIISDRPLVSRNMKPGSTRMLVNLQARQKHRPTQASADYSFDMPVVVDTNNKPRTFHFYDIDDTMAHEHGYTSADAMKTALKQTYAIKENTNPTFYAYTSERALPIDLPEDENKAGGYIVRRMRDVHDAWKGASDDSVEEARKYVAKIAKDESDRAKTFVDNITPLRDQPTNVRARNGARPLPSAWRAARGVPIGGYSDDGDEQDRLTTRHRLGEDQIEPPQANGAAHDDIDRPRRTSDFHRHRAATKPVRDPVREDGEATRPKKWMPRVNLRPNAPLPPEEGADPIDAPLHEPYDGPYPMQQEGDGGNGHFRERLAAALKDKQKGGKSGGG